MGLLSLVCDQHTLSALVTTHKHMIVNMTIKSHWISLQLYTPTMFNFTCKNSDRPLVTAANSRTALTSMVIDVTDTNRASRL